MKPLLIALALATAVPTQPAPKPDPVKALKAQVVPGRGVTVSVVTRMSGDGKHFLTARTTRVAGFRKGWRVDVDDSTSLYTPLKSELIEDDLRFPTLLIRAKGKSYTSGGRLIGRLPLDKKWVYTDYREESFADFGVDLFHPGTLEALLATASSVTPRTAKGSIRVSKIPGLPLGGRPGSDPKLAWALWFDAKGRVTRLATRLSHKTNDDMMLGINSDQRFTGWGARVTVEPPPADLVMSQDDLPELELPGEAAMKLTEALPKEH
ncbi:hypothetical protein [Nonomuraea africana]|uniref:DUF2092 domain-containing protein n=1 Tax=Nonomuraea africana TaxID=46171 RepID=A0ABR9KV67_9ACTN|nr:hypothetical protein [Nonomuraea africana]MBE1565513.1 hypothetical protein [Nonomuraea africana]